MTAYDPQANEQFHASRDPQTIANRELSGAERVIWDAAWEDVRRLENADNAQPLLAQPLWLTFAPQYAGDDWRNLSARLRARGDEHWAVWIDWYEAWLAGGGELSEKDEIARVSLPNEPERKVRSSPTPAFRDLSSRRVHAWRAAPHHAR